ncbi:MAG TPA: iron-containing alcohol dehydrogenase, partial [Spirochaetota bacterium]|nr:iron-containing alcohol dehydrogenase [Spirochaetota bacterium]
TYTLPAYQTACGAADIMAHIMERYFTNTTDVELTDRLCEAAMKTMINNVPQVLKKPDDYASRADVMWTGCVAHNDILGTGREGDWGSHMIEHEISAIYDVAHGAGLAVVFPAWMKYVYKHNVSRFVQFASRVFNVEIDFYNPEKTALEGIRRLEMFFESIGLPVRLSQMNIKNDKISEMAAKSTQKDSFAVGNFVKLKTSDVAEILKLAL